MLAASELPSHRARGLCGLAWAKYHTGKLTESLEAFQRLVEKFPEDALVDEALYMEGVLLERLQRPDEALAIYQQITDKHPRHADIPSHVSGGRTAGKQETV